MQIVYEVKKPFCAQAILNIFRIYFTFLKKNNFSHNTLKSVVKDLHVWRKWKNTQYDVML